MTNHVMGLFLITLSLTLSNAANEISCNNLTGITDPPTTFAPTQSPTPYSPKQYPGRIPSPCIKLGIRLQTENVLPLNINPDPVSNIAIIGKAIANITGGVVHVPQSPQFPEDDRYDYDPNLIWDLNDDCVIDNQITDSFLPSESWSPEGNMSITRHGKQKCESHSWWSSESSSASNNSDCYFKDYGFTLTKAFQTPHSIAYMFHVDSVPLYLSHDCRYDYLKVKAAIYRNDTAIAFSKSVYIYADDDPNHTLKFHYTVALYPDTAYEIRYKLIGGYPRHCSFEDVSFAADRRRLQEGDVIPISELLTATGTANGCLLGNHLALSDEMKRGISAMCGDADTVAEIEHGLFRQHTSNGALKNHLYKAGSLRVFDANDVESFSTDAFPRFGVLDPCLTVDEANRIIYAVGGATEDGNAVDWIQGYQFDDDTLTSGRVMDELDDWKLDKPRYGASCLYWNDDGVGKLVVISGMAHVRFEFSNRRRFYRDIRIFPVPDDPTQFIPPNLPIDATKNLAKNIIDSKPVLVNNHELYLFGGKTHRASKAYVSRFDLHDISTANAFTVQQMTLTDHAALPLIDAVYVEDANEIKCCYMIFGGQQYASSRLQGEVDTTYLQLFCNENMKDECEANANKRRLSDHEVPIPTWADFDLKMLSKTVRPRRLGHYSSYDRRWPTPQPPQEVLVRDYHYGLDGVWYNFTAESEICFEDNDELSDVVQQYELLMASKPRGAEWVDFSETLSETLLSCSLESYRGWSDGFGAVRVLDLEIVDVSYDDTMTPTPEPTPEPTPLPTVEPSTPVPTTEWPTRFPTLRPTHWPTVQWPTKKWSSSSKDSGIYVLCCECVRRHSHHGGCPADPDCETAICDLDSFCCVDVWDASCSTQAHAICEGEDIPKCCGECTTAQSKDGSPGCESDKTCETELCGDDPFCCGEDDNGEGYWDEKCAKKAWNICTNDE